MAAFLSCVVSNTVFAGCLAVFAVAVTKAWRSPHLAHALWLLVLVKLVTPPIIHVPVVRFMVASHVDNIQSELPGATEPPSSSPLSPREYSSRIASPVSPLLSVRGDTSTHHAETGMWDAFPEVWPQWLLTAWVIGAVVFVSVGLRRHMRLLPLIADSQAPDPVFAKDAEQLAQQIGLARCPPLRVTAAHVCPFVTPGVRTPTVVLPRRLLAELNRDQISSMLAHELAHIHRRDHWVRIFELCVLSLNWWNPIAWWASRQLQQAEEECCDAWVLWVLPEKRRAYSQTLLRTVEYLTGENVLVAPAGTSFHSCQLERRIDVVMNRMVNRKMSLAACAFTLALGTIILPVGVALGQADRDAVTPEVAARSYENYLKTVQSVSFHSSFKDRNAEKSDVYTNSLSQNWWIDFKGRRLRRITKRLNPNTGKTVVGPRAALNETLLTPKKYYQISADPDTFTAKAFTGYLHEPGDYWKTDMGLLYLSYPFGYFQDGRQDRYIPEMFQNMSVEEDGSPLVVLSCKTKECELKIRLDRSKGWMANRIEYSRTVLSKDPYRPNYFLYTVDHASNHDGVWIPDSFRCEVSRPEGKEKLLGDLRVVDGKFIIASGGADIGVDFIEKEKSTLIAEVTLSDIRIAALDDFNFQLQTIVPDGMEVHMQDARQSEFRWLGGKVVPEN
jgi:beta-lactamase regulating signal transducer with metallopeptidase domain